MVQETVEAASFLEEVEDFLRRNRWTATQLGIYTVNSGGLVAALRNGRIPRKVTIERIRLGMRLADEAEEAADAALIAAVRKHGGIVFDTDGTISLYEGAEISRKRFMRLLTMQKIVPTGDSMFGAEVRTGENAFGVHSQTYVAP